ETRIKRNVPQFPGELGKNLILLSHPRKRRVGSRLTVGIRLMLISNKKQCPVPDNRSAQSRREVMESGAFVRTLSALRRSQWKLDGLTCEPVWLRVVGRAVKKSIASLS